VEVVGSALAAGAVVWLPFDVAGLSAPFGFVVCWVIAFVLIYGTISSLNHGALVAKDRVATFCIWTGGMIAMVPLVAVLAYVVYRGAPVVANHFPHFLLADFRYASGNAPISQVGVAHAIVGTVEQVGIATLITAPLAVLAATYLAESNGLFARLVRTMADAKVGLPSIITGLFVYLVWVAPRHTNGYSGVAASFALATMMLPIITRTAEEMIRLVPGSLREAAYALGAPRWKVTLRVILPTARAGIVSAVILGIARAVGETAPVLFTAHGSTRMNWNPFHGVQADLPLTGLEAILSTSNRLKAEGWGDLLVLVVLVLLLFVAARAVGSGKKKKRLRALFRRMSKPKEEVVVP
jgi:phosphate transport system permease protein